MYHLPWHTARKVMLSIIKKLIELSAMDKNYIWTGLLILLAFVGPVHLEAQTCSGQLKINQIQVIGSHNSYKKAIDPRIYTYFAKQDTAFYRSLLQVQYEHIPPVAQLDLGLRNLEIDAYADPKGGKFSTPKIREMIPDLPTIDAKHAMDKPGFKVIHIPDIDYNSWYGGLEDCLLDLRRWSDENPEHAVVFVTFEAKDGKSTYSDAISFNEKLLNELDSLLLSTLGVDKLILPDDVRGNYPTLREAVEDGQWPTVREAAGKFLFILDDKARKRSLYIQNHPSLIGRVMFVNAEPQSPEAATFILNDPYREEIVKYVKEGYIVRTRADSETMEARNNDFSRFEKAKESGAQIITTDYYYKSNFFESNYFVRFGPNDYSRPNPVNIVKQNES